MTTAVNLANSTKKVPKFDINIIMPHIVICMFVGLSKL